MANIFESKALREERGLIITQMNELTASLKNDDDETRKFTPEETETFDKLDGAQQDLLEKISDAERCEKVADLKASMDTPAYEPKAYTGSGAITREDRYDALRGWCLANTEFCTQAHRDAAIKCGVNLQSPSLKFNLRSNAPTSVEQIRKDLYEYRGSTVVQSVGVAGAGGHSVPDELMGAMEVALLAHGGVRQVANVIRTGSGGDLPIPTVNDTTQKGAILNENTAEVVAQIPFGQVVLKAFKYSSKLIKLSTELMQDSNINLPQFIGEALGTRIARITNDHFTVSATTNESANPQGLITSAVAATTGAGTASANSVTYGEILNLIHSVDPAYRQNSKFMFNDTTLKLVKSMVDTQNRPLWTPGLAFNSPDTIGGYGFGVNQSMASQALNARFMAFGDYSKYWIRDVSAVSVMRLEERFAELGQVAFLALSRHDGRAVNGGTNAIKVLISGSST